LEHGWVKIGLKKNLVLRRVWEKLGWIKLFGKKKGAWTRKRFIGPRLWNLFYGKESLRMKE